MEEAWRLAGRINARGHAQLRLEAIDTLETHYAGQHQPLPLGLKALNHLLQGLGITAVQTDAALASVVSAQGEAEGYILARATDKYQRPIAFVFAGASAEADGASVYLTPQRLTESINCKALQAGLAYPTYYQGLFPDLRTACTAATRHARNQQLEDLVRKIEPMRDSSSPASSRSRINM